MLGAHNIFTYQKAVNPFINLFKAFWKCQNKTLDELYYDKQVRFFDIRICKQKNIFTNKIKWQTAHGLARFKYKFKSIDDIFQFMYSKYPYAKYRVILERCSENDVNEFNKQIDKWIEFDGKLLKLYNYNCTYIGIKTPWKILYKNKDLHPKVIHDYCCRIFNLNRNLSFDENLKRFKITQLLKPWALKNNPKLTQEQIKDENTLYFMDFI